MRGVVPGDKVGGAAGKQNAQRERKQKYPTQQAKMTWQ
jgi:hypothetical protein